MTLEQHIKVIFLMGLLMVGVLRWGALTTHLATYNTNA
jgi:hypothetical protein